MKENFNFSEFLMEKGFAYTNYGTHNLYEIEKDEHNYAVNIQGGKMNTNESRTPSLLNDVVLPKDLKSAEKWLGEFLGTAKEKPKPKTV